MKHLTTPSFCALFAATLLAASPSFAADTSFLMYNGPDRQQKLEEGAKKEGEMMLYTSLIVDQTVRPLLDAFKAKYPYIDGQYYRADTPQILQKVTTEVRTNQGVADVVEGSASITPLVKANALAQFHSPLVDLNPRYADPKGLYAVTRLSYMAMAYNTKLVPPGTQPKTYEELADPKWKGKISWQTIEQTGAGLFITTVRHAMGEDKAVDYLQRLSKQNLMTVSESARQLVNFVMQGEYPIALSIFSHHPVISAKKGAPVATQMLDPTPSISGAVMISKAARHPYASQLFVDFMLSEAGQEIMKKADYFPVHPKVKPNPDLVPVTPEGAGVSEYYLNPEAFTGEDVRSHELLVKYFQ